MGSFMTRPQIGQSGEYLDEDEFGIAGIEVANDAARFVGKPREHGAHCSGLVGRREQLLCSSRALERADQRASDALPPMGRIDVDQFEEVVTEKGPATGLTEQPRVALGNPTRAVLKLAPDQIDASAIESHDIVEGDEAVGVFWPSEAQGETDKLAHGAGIR
jgi:hypothetical protein